MLGAYCRAFSILLQQATETQALVPETSQLPRAKVVSSALELTPPSASTTLRLSKRMSSAGICSRRQAERLIAAGLVKVGNQRVYSNVAVDLNAAVTVARNPEMKSTTVPIPESAKLWAFYKPPGLITTHSDPMGRPSVFDYLKKMDRFEGKHVISVGRLDFNSEGLLLLTNNGDLSQSLERSRLIREYRIRAFGKWSTEHIEEMRRGVTIKGVNYRPMNVWMEHKQTSNTWFQAQLREGKNREIRRIFEHFGLRVNRLIRTRYGPFVLEGLKTGELREEHISQEVHKEMFNHFRKTAKETEKE